MLFAVEVSVSTSHLTCRAVWELVARRPGCRRGVGLLVAVEPGPFWRLKTPAVLTAAGLLGLAPVFFPIGFASKRCRGCAVPAAAADWISTLRR